MGVFVAAAPLPGWRLGWHAVPTLPEAMSPLSVVSSDDEFATPSRVWGGPSHPGG
jgi:hypothetical protein